ncbi:hypothetical protein SEA_ROMERO_56 [Streptomyces phage Romero]|uniref:Uncharacterized protein n=3 Tax=Immanueltrevirus immanuel3 TaxID=2846399 RepID=A0A2H5BML9_9CAUD|nr:hypothetical protein SEA_PERCASTROPHE_56 [Streptomyces phage Percastrophe]AUG87489.1 hypothetical protein SEA_ROMERO_56 [Streptomyces phage Romero]AUG87552.1 hypothetical protein SEA_TORITOKI_56 [Streptomyces phage ToriToki]
MGKRRSDNLNSQPYNQNASPEQKANEFDRQYGQNRQYSNAPAADAAGVPKAKGKHRK